MLLSSILALATLAPNALAADSCSYKALDWGHKTIQVTLDGTRYRCDFARAETAGEFPYKTTYQVFQCDQGASFQYTTYGIPGTLYGARDVSVDCGYRPF